ncbi:aldose 1-epimerase family protein [Pedobacter sp. GR22-6]|uniref:aldose 1-epimerase family protein n=1 Tax=Pedobacter sp. GR22-6 TaxID=3127957 RepID=UPI00307F81F9
MIILENTNIKASFSTKGAELQSLYNKNTEREYLWDGNPDFWGKYSPILFPIVGGLKENRYILEGREYELPRHGFARDHQFDSKQLSETELIFILRQSSGTFSVYPFEFDLLIRYELIEEQLRCTYEVNNPADNPLFFSIGAHPAFAIPTGRNLSYTDYYLEFNKDITLEYHKIKHDLIDTETITLPLKDGKLPLKYELFYDDALVFKTLKSDLISLKNHKNDHGLDFSFKDFPYFGIWTAKNADFICLEPWCGIADGVHHNQQLKEKEGIITLEAQQEWKRSWEIRSF